jgi:hypothetical protein
MGPWAAGGRLEGTRRAVGDSGPMPRRGPLKQLRHKHYQILRLVFSGATHASIARVLNINRWSVWRCVSSPVAQAVPHAHGYAA